MKKFLLSAAAFFVIFSISLGLSPATAANLDVYIGVDNFIWKEFDTDGSRLLKEKGPVYVLGVSSKFNPTADLTVKTKGEIYGGIIDYDGQTSIGTPAQTDTTYFGIKLEGDLGWKVQASDYSTVEPFAGLGMRWWARDLETTSTASGYTEIWRTIYARVGVRGDYKVSDSTKMFAEVAYKLPVSNDETVHNYPGASGNFDLKPGKKGSMSAELGVQWKLFKASLFYETMRFSRSDYVAIPGMPGFVACQPKSHADIIGLRAGFSF
ncbi:MAG: autotransporter domain-containing protein [Nitrospirae bacterium]|nr:autotransporter domain-containing protein [Nitrospirota bacterium]